MFGCQLCFFLCRILSKTAVEWLTGGCSYFCIKVFSRRFFTKKFQTFTFLCFLTRGVFKPLHERVQKIPFSLLIFTPKNKESPVLLNFSLYQYFRLDLAGKVNINRMHPLYNYGGSFFLPKYHRQEKR